MEKEYVTIDPVTNEEVRTPISKAEIVKPDFPDYYMKRRAEYPTIGEQLDALWKGAGTTDYEAIKSKILGVKQKNPKPTNAVLPPSVEL
jgi:hypothetical protein